MGHNLTVEVLDSDGDPVCGTTVLVYVDGIMTGGLLNEEFTDDSGHAEFETGGDYEGWREIVIRVRGQRFGPFRIDGGAYTVQLE